MKLRKIFTILLAACLMFSGCGSTGAPTETVEAPKEIASPAAERETVPTENTNTILVNSVDELIDAIGNDTSITLAPGEYLLSDASTYGKETGNPFCRWVDVGDGYGLVITDVNALSISGSGKENTALESEPRMASVLQFEDCTRSSISNLTIGHTIQPDGCAAGVLDFRGCYKINVENTGLYGCGTEGIYANLTRQLTVSDCEIYQCSMDGIGLLNCQNASIRNCYVHDLRNDEYTSSAAFLIFDSSDVVFEKCNFQNNILWNLACIYSSSNIRIVNSGFADNEVYDAAFYLFESSCSLENTEITGNKIDTWYSENSGMLHDEHYNYLTAADLTVMYDYVADPMEGGLVDAEMQEVHVSTVDEFLNAIAPNTCIILDAATYDLSQANGYGGPGGVYYEWRDEFDGPALYINNVNNLTIMSGDSNKNAHTISAVPRYANVLSFNGCSNISLIGFTAGHTVEPGSCSGGVISFEYSDNLYVNNCNLYGCGILGIQSDRCRNLIATNCNIYECSYGGIQLFNTTDIDISGCSFWSLGGPQYDFIGCSRIVIDGLEHYNGTYNN